MPENTITPPTKIGEWTTQETIEVLSRPIPKNLLKKKGKYDYLPWQEVQRILNKYCPGHKWEVLEKSIMDITENGRYLYLKGRLTIICSDGETSREAIGSLKISEVQHADPIMTAEQIAFKKAACRFGLALGLRD